MKASSSRIGVVIATRNRSEGLCRVLETLRELPENPQVVVVDNASTDESPRVLTERFPEVHMIRLEHNLGAAARNHGVLALDTPLVAFCDDDSWWAPGALEKAVRIFGHRPRLGLLAAKVLVGEAERVDPTCDLMAASPLGHPSDLPGPRILGFIACGAVVRREAFLQAGGFDAHFGVGGEEDHLAMRMAAAGWDLAYVPDLVAHHHPSPIRDRQARAEILTRNSLWTTWLLRPAFQVAKATLAVLPRAVVSAPTRKGVIQAVLGLPWVCRQRARLPDPVEAMARTLGEVRT